ncbi:MAG: hypothetical protein NT062_13850 [Proteobacteria bacterium]|nr:hypothetical protein [Pseudomonadota bacterium]
MTPWLFGRTRDLVIFGGTAIVALLLVAVAPLVGGSTVGKDAPEWTWIVGVLLVDVAHVWSTAFIVYLDPAEWRRRPALYGALPIGCFFVGVCLYVAGGEATFWRVIAYLAVFHFIRQQFGWVMMYRARIGERTGRWIDGATIYATTLYPLLVWHARPPRDFAWMRDGDFVTLPAWLATGAGVAYVALLVAYAARAGRQLVRREPVSWGKHLVVATTAACWYVGIVATNSDYAFTITNVFIHGIPYLALVYVYARSASREVASAGGATATLLAGRRGLATFLGTLWLVAYVEELAWDRAIWHERGYLFGAAWDSGDWALVIAPLLATPQLVHYVLDGFLWRRRANPRLGRLL